jgi:hypothetical protein
LSSGVIVSSSADVKVKANYAGGLANFNEGSIEFAHATGSATGMASAGGLVTINTGMIDQSFATGTVSGEIAGGFVGQQGSPGTINDSYARGAITSSAGEGGFVGDDSQAGAVVATSYSTGSVAAADDGGFVCDVVPSNLTNDYWDTTTSGTTYGECNDLNVSGLTGLTTAQLQSGLPSGFNPSIWAESSKINGGFPYLSNNPPPKK